MNTSNSDIPSLPQPQPVTSPETKSSSFKSYTTSVTTIHSSLIFSAISLDNVVIIDNEFYLIIPSAFSRTYNIVFSSFNLAYLSTFNTTSGNVASKNATSGNSNKSTREMLRVSNFRHFH